MKLLWCTLLVAPQLIQAASVTLAWNASPSANVIEYIVHYGTAVGVYSAHESAGMAMTKTITGLTDGVSYYFVVTARDSLAQSDYSNEVTWRLDVPPPASPSNLRLIPGSGVNGPMIFDGIGSGSWFAGSDTLAGITNGTIVMWLFMDGHSDAFGGIVNDIDDQATYGWAITRGATNNLHIMMRAGNQAAADTGTIPLSTWLHVVVNLSQTPHCWINAIEVPLTINEPFPMAPAANTAPLRFGLFRNQYRFIGQLESVAIYTNMVSLAEMQLAAADSTRRRVPTGYSLLFQ